MYRRFCGTNIRLATKSSTLLSTSRVILLQKQQFQQQTCPIIRTTTSYYYYFSTRRGVKDSWNYNRGDDQSNNNNNNTWKDRPKKRVLLFGSSGVLGTEITKQLSLYNNCSIIGVDIQKPPEFNINHTSRKWQLDDFIHLEPDDSKNIQSVTTKLTKEIHTIVSTKFPQHDISVQRIKPIPEYETYDYDPTIDSEYFEPYNGTGFDAIICASGGFTTDPLPTKLPSSSVDNDTDNEHSSIVNNILQNGIQYSTGIQSMMEQNLYPVLVSSYLIQHYMNRNGLYVAIGATTALGPTPDTIAYGISKAAVHHTITTYGSLSHNSIVSKSLRTVSRSIRSKTSSYSILTPNNPPELQVPIKESSYETVTVLGLLPTTIDTPTNRKFMSSSTASTTKDTWTPPSDIAQQIGLWIQQPTLRPHSGSLIKVITKKNTNTVTSSLSKTTQQQQLAAGQQQQSQQQQKDVITTFELVR